MEESDFGFGRQEETNGREELDASLEIVCEASLAVNNCDLLVVPPSGITVDEVDRKFQGPER